MIVSTFFWSRKSRTCLPLYRQNAEVAAMTELDVTNNQDSPTQPPSTTVESDSTVSESVRKGITSPTLLLFGNFQLIALEPSSGDLDSVKHQRRILASLWHDPEDTGDSRFKNSQYESG